MESLIAEKDEFLNRLIYYQNQESICENLKNMAEQNAIITL